MTVTRVGSWVYFISKGIVLFFGLGLYINKKLFHLPFFPFEDDSIVVTSA